MTENGRDGRRPDIAALAPAAEAFTPYDAAHMLTYARLLDAAQAGHDWRQAARAILGLEIDTEQGSEDSGNAHGVAPRADGAGQLDDDIQAAERCWRSHHARALWIVSEAGLAAAAAANADGWFGAVVADSAGQGDRSGEEATAAAGQEGGEGRDDR